MHQNKSVLIIAMFYLDGSQIYGDYRIEHVFFSADFIGRVFNELSHFITREQNGWGKNISHRMVLCVTHEMAMLCLESSEVCLVSLSLRYVNA